MNEERYTGTERRKQPDWMIKGATILNVLAWLLTTFSLLAIDIASPNQDNMFTHYFDMAERVVWDEFWILAAYILLVMSVVSCVVSFVLHVLRKRRKADKLRVSIIIINALTIIGFILFIYRFGFQLF
ncbi:MAG: hypothetical protein FWD90_03875 [Defluviitaleaceae bacterium]|nr:hypothetical protein [Defluviitaleaceae bacterium]